MDSQKLLKALDDDSNEALLNFTTKKLREMTKNILKETELSREVQLDYANKLRDYRYVDEISDFKHGSYLRWIDISSKSNLDMNMILNKGAIFCEICIEDTGIIVGCKNITGRHFKLKMDDNLIFQKLTDTELVLLSALDHLSK